MGLVKFITVIAVIQGIVCQELTSKLLKQAADSLLDPLLPKISSYNSYARLPEPSSQDLISRRLQASLDAQVGDNWKALNEPQRYLILMSKDPVVQILKSFVNIKDQIKEFEMSMQGTAVESQLNNLLISPAESMRSWIRYWDTLRKYIGQVGQLYTYFQSYVDQPESADKSSLNDFVSSMVETKISESSLKNMLNAFHKTVLRQDANSTLFSFLYNSFQENEEHLCSMSQSPYQLVYNLYNIIAITELKGYAMLQFSYMILRINNKGNFTSESEVAKTNFERQALEKLGSVREVLPELSREYRRCDPKNHKEGETFLQVKGFLQGYIENEVDMNEQKSCKSQCSQYTYAESTGCYKDLFCAKQRRCSGRVFDCEFYNADAWVCMSQNPDRRYDWIQYEDGTILGDNTDQCINKIKVDSWWRYIFWHCSYCLCKCDEILPTSERYWALVSSLADTENGYLVTGARFIKRGKIFYLEIEQAKALQEGGVDESTKVWVESPQISEDNLTLNPQIFTMSYEQRAIDLDTLSAPEGHVLTGLKLRSIGGHINLEAQVTPIRFNTAELLKEQSIWIANDNTPASQRPRNLLPLVIPDIPTRLIGQNKVDASHDKYLQFDTSSAHKDVAQTTIPFIEALPVSPSPSAWLSGAGIYHKGRIGFGGFIGISVETFDFSRHLLSDLEAPSLNMEYVRAEG